MANFSTTTFDGQLNEGRVNEGQGAGLDVPERLPWSLAAPLIGAMSAGLWLGLWQLTRLALAG